LKTGTIWLLTVIAIVVFPAHCPAPGVKVYVVVPTVAVLIVAGLHVPVIPFVEVAGKPGAALFWQSALIAVNVGRI
jgi:hypothetical protein